MTSERTCRLAGSVLALCCVAGVIEHAAGRVAADAQSSQTQQPQTPPFRSRIDVARVTVAVIDTRTGEPVAGLSERDFVVREDGARQTVSTFATEPRSSVSAEAAAASTASTASSDRNRRIFLIVLGHDRVEGPVQPHDGVVRFVRERLRPQDLVSVMAFNRATPFTTDHGHVALVVEQLKIRNNAIQLRIGQQARTARFTREDISAEVQAEIDAAFAPGGNLALVPRSTTSMLARTGEFRKEDLTWRPWNRLMLRDLLKVYAGLEFLRPLEGEKHLVCLTPGLMLPIAFQNDISLQLDSREDDARLVARANDAQVALDIIHTGDFTVGAATSVMASRNVSEMSGGQFTSTRTAQAALGRIDQATQHRYVLGYVPTNAVMDGKYRNVTVQVSRPGVTVLYPHGYTARAEAPPLDVREVVTRARLRDAAATDLEQDDIAVQASASVVGTGSARQIKVELKIDASRLSLRRIGARREGIIDMLIVCGDANQKVVGSLNQQMTLSLDEAQYNQAIGGGIPYTTTVPIVAAATRVKVLVYDYDSDMLGAANVRLR